jgi:hypothetical protein
MHRYVRILTVVCAAGVLATTGAAFATDTSELARAAFQANERRQFPVAIGLFNKAIARRSNGACCCSAAEQPISSSG